MGFSRTLCSKTVHQAIGAIRRFVPYYNLNGSGRKYEISLKGVHLILLIALLPSAGFLLEKFVEY